MPQECLILTMKANQKYFPLLDAAGKLTNQFLVVSNIRPGRRRAAVIGGNERVVRPRLADAKFFFDQDRKKTLESRVPALAKVVYHNKLGTPGRARRSACARIARDIGAAARRRRAGGAGRPGRAAGQGRPADRHGRRVPRAAGHHGRLLRAPRRRDRRRRLRHRGPLQAALRRRRAAAQRRPASCVALADKLETLVGMFGIGQLPTGDKDPFALRRHALGVIRMLIERDLPLDAGAPGATRRSPRFPAGASARRRPSSRDFIYERLRRLACASRATARRKSMPWSRCGRARWADVAERLAAVRAFAALPEAAAAGRGQQARRQHPEEERRRAPPAAVDAGAAASSRPSARWHDALARVGAAGRRAFDAGDYTASLQALAALKAPVDAFFDGVMVNADDPALRANRLGAAGARCTRR